MVTKLIMACILSATLLSCNGQNTNTINYATVEPLHINRFDKDLFRLIDTEDTTLQPELIKQYPEMLSPNMLPWRISKNPWDTDSPI